MSEILYGRQVVAECLRAGRRAVHRLFVAAGARGTGRVDDVLQAAARRRLPVLETDKSRLDRLTSSGHHQGLALEAEPYPYVSIEDVLAARREGEPPFLLILDHLQDPQNLGSLLRTAEGAGVTGVVIPKDRAAAVTPAVVRASSGASEHLLVARVANIVAAMGAARDAGLWVYGLDSDPGAPRLAEARLDGPVALVVGNEGQGLARLVRERCDARARLPMRGHVESLNAAVSGAIALYEIRRQRDARAAKA